MLSKALGRITHRVIGVAWDTWRQQASQQRRLTSVASKGVRRIFNRTMTLALGRWQESTVELRRQRQAKAPVLKAILHGLVVFGLAWTMRRC